MKKLIALGAVLSVFLVPSVSHAAITITGVTVNGATSTQVKPLSIVRVSMTVQVTQGSKWEGIQWGINNSGIALFPAFINIDDNDRRDFEGNRDDDHNGHDNYSDNDNHNHSGGNGTFTEKFYILAPLKNGVYNANFLAFEKKKGSSKPTATGSVFVLPNAIRVGNSTPPPPPPVDTQAPVIAAHADISAIGTSAGAVVTYTDPPATDNVDASVAVSCMPASGSQFATGTTVVTCNAQDAAGNNATPVSFNVIVTAAPPAPVTLATQPDEFFLCAPDWETCFTGGTPRANIDLGLGSTLSAGSLKSVTIAKDASSPFVSQPWIIEIHCFTDAAYTAICPDWVQPNAWNGGRADLVSEFTSATTDNTHWTADFTNPAHEANLDGSLPVTFKPNYYYRLVINDNLWNIGAYGSSAGVPYYKITGMTL